MRVFVTVGSMLPFDRLTLAMDAWAAANPAATVVAQVGEGGCEPKAMRFSTMLEPERYRAECAAADVIVSHVGMGTVITAAELNRPLVAMARQRALGEVTSDHQSATAVWLRDRPGVFVVEGTESLAGAIAAASSTGGVRDLGQSSRDQLIGCVRDFLKNTLRR